MATLRSTLCARGNPARSPLRGRRVEWALITAAALLSIACRATASGPPAIVVDRTVCSHCGMLVSEPAYAAAYQTQGHDARLFDDIGCMLDAARREATSPTAFWFQDAAGGGWLDADEATFVVSPHIPTPMSGGVLAYADAAAAERAAATLGGEVVRSIQELTIRKGEGQ